MKLRANIGKILFASVFIVFSVQIGFLFQYISLSKGIDQKVSVVVSNFKAKSPGHEYVITSYIACKNNQMDQRTCEKRMLTLKPHDLKESDLMLAINDAKIQDVQLRIFVSRMTSNNLSASIFTSLMGG